MSKRITIIISKSIFHQLVTKEALDIALLFGSFEQDIQLILLNDAVSHVVKNQQPKLLGSKDYTAVYNALPFYDIEQVFVCQHSLNIRNIAPSSCMEVAKVVSVDDIQLLISRADVVLRF